MKKTCRSLPLILSSVLAACGGGGDLDTAQGAADGSSAQELQSAAQPTTSQVAAMYAPDFVAPAASGADLNDAGDVVGKSYPDPGCGPFCLPPQEPVVWKGRDRIVLPLLPGTDVNSHYPQYINNSGLVAGMAGTVGSATRAAVWVPSGASYAGKDLGVFPGTSSVDVAGLDDQGRLVGWATLGGAIPTLALPFMWSQAAGMVNLQAQGYPNEPPAAMSRGGMVVTTGSWYQLGDPRSVVRLPPLPQGFVGAGSNGSAINDFGDQAHYLVSIQSESLVYPFRLTAGGTWQQISPVGTGRLSRSGIGSINAARDVTFTALGTGMVAPGPSGVGQTLASRVSPAYPGATVTEGGPMNAAGHILAQVMMGRSTRLVKLRPVTPCTADCLVSSALTVAVQFVEDRKLPGSCVQGGNMYNLTSVAATITSEAGTPLANVQVSGRFLDDYWTNLPVTGITDASGVVRWSYKGPCGVGAVAFLIEDASQDARTLDRTRGTLVASALPGTSSEPPPPPPPPTTTNVAPVAQGTVTCNAARTCTFSASSSYDPDGSIAAYRWTANNGTLWSTQAVFTRTFSKGGRETVVLQVTDNGGASSSTKITFNVPRR